MGGWFNHPEKLIGGWVLSGQSNFSRMFGFFQFHKTPKYKLTQVFNRFICYKISINIILLLSYIIINYSWNLFESKFDAFDFVTFDFHLAIMLPCKANIIVSAYFISKQILSTGFTMFQSICTTFVQRRPNDVGPTLFKCCTNVLCLMG